MSLKIKRFWYYEFYASRTNAVWNTLVGYSCKKTVTPTGPFLWLTSKKIMLRNKEPNLSPKYKILLQKRHDQVYSQYRKKILFSEFDKNLVLVVKRHEVYSWSLVALAPNNLRRMTSPLMNLRIIITRK